MVCAWRSRLESDYRCVMEALPGSRFCIFHEPGEKDVEEFARQLYAQIDEEGSTESRNSRYNFRGYVFPIGVGVGDERKPGKIVLPRHIETSCILSEATIRGDVNFQRAEIRGGVNFTDTKIEGNVLFDLAKIEGSVVFRRAEIGWMASFVSAEIKGSVSFVDAKVGTNACISAFLFSIHNKRQIRRIVRAFDMGMISNMLRDAFFANGIALSDRASVEVVTSEEWVVMSQGEYFIVRLEDEALNIYNYRVCEPAIYFMDAKIEGGVFFVGAKVKGRVEFQGARIEGKKNKWEEKIWGVFGEPVFFENAEIDGRVSFVGAEIGERVSFVDAKVRRDVDFWHAKIKGDFECMDAKIGGLFLSNAEIDGVINLKGATICGPVNVGLVDAAGLWLGEEKPTISGWRKSLWYRCGLVLKDWDTAPAFWRFAQRLFEKQGKRDRADAAFYFSRVTRLSPWRIPRGETCKEQAKQALKRLATMPAWLADCLFLRWPIGYGASVPRTIVTWLFLILTFAIVYATGPGLLKTAESGIWSLRHWLTALYSSMVVFATLGTGAVNEERALSKVLISTQAILGALLMALTVVVLTRKFMR